MNRRRVLYLAGLAASFAALGLGARALVAERERSPSAPLAEDAVPVRVDRVVLATSSAGTVATGVLAPAREVRLAFAVPGVVSDIHAREGDTVRRGQSLALLDAVPFRAEAERARARVEFLRARAERSRHLASNGAMALEELDGEEAELASAEAELAHASWSLERSTLRAPFAGKIRRDEIELGQVVAPGTPAFELIAVDTLEIVVSLAVADRPRVDLAASVTVRSLEFGGRIHAARVEKTPVSGDPRSGALPVRVTVPNPDLALLAGTMAEVRFAPSATQAMPSLPLAAIRVRPGGSYVFLVEEGRARAQRIETGAVRDRRVEVISGLTAGDLFVAEPPDRLRDGDTVLIVEG